MGGAQRTVLDSTALRPPPPPPGFFPKTAREAPHRATEGAGVWRLSLTPIPTPPWASVAHRQLLSQPQTLPFPRLTREV